jgi:uncharacterized protein (DUF1501 family)
MGTRRHFLKSSSLIALAPTVPGFLASVARAAKPERDGRILVVVELSGGNDGINTVIPFADEGYARARRALRIPKEQVLKLNDRVGLHPAMAGTAKLVETGQLAIVQGVGYPNPNRSHFESMAIWQTARFDADEQGSYGWLGRGLDAGKPPEGGVPSSIALGSGALPAALRARRAVSSTLARPEDFALDDSVSPVDPAGHEPGDDLTSFVRRSTLEAYTTADRMTDVLKARRSDKAYPSSGLASSLKLVGQMIKAGLGTRVYYTAQSGYDTHSAQVGTHFNLLSELSEALKAFQDDMTAAKLADRVLVMGFSEFGRRVNENDSAGTDHGTAGPVLIACPAVKPGPFGPTPSLLDLQDGDLKMAVDFRRVYATLLQQWLGLPADAALGGTFEPLPFLRA